MKKLCALACALGVVHCGEDTKGLSADTAVAGLYRQTSHVTISNEYPGVDAFETQTLSHGYSEIFVEGPDAFLQETFCHIDSLGGPVNVVIPDALTRAFKPPKHQLELIEGADGSVVYVLPEHPIPVGARLEDPINDPLPTSSDDPRVFDQDGDGKPGVTILIEGTETAELYMVRRERYTYELEVVAPGRLRGKMKDRSEQIVIGATDPLLNLMPDVKTVEDPAKTFIEYERAPANVTRPDCDALAVQP